MNNSYLDNNPNFANNPIKLKDLISKTFTKEELCFLEKKMNDLLDDEEIKKLRSACSEEVKNKIIKYRMEPRLNTIYEELQEKFSSGSKPAKEDLITFFKDKLNLSYDDAKQIAKEYMYNLVSQTPNAFRNACKSIEGTLLKKEITAFSKELSEKKLLTESGWCKFIHAVNCTTDNTINSIADNLGLNKEEKEELLKKNIPDYFIVNDAVSNETDERMKLLTSDLVTLEDKKCFCSKFGISPDTIKKFNVSLFKKVNPTPSNKVKYYELFKLIVLFGMEEAEATKFLEKAERTFVMTLDLAFLTAITKGYEIKPKEPVYVALITYFLSGQVDMKKYYTDCPKFTSPYQFKYIKEAACEEGLIQSPHQLTN